MILEAAPLQVKPGQSKAFEDAFRQAQSIIASMIYDPFPTVLHYETVVFDAEGR